MNRRAMVRFHLSLLKTYNNENNREKLGSHLSRKNRKRYKYSKKYIEIFNFYLQIYRKGLITFCGSDVKVIFDINSEEGKFTFRKFDNGEFKNKNIVSKHPNIVKSVIIGKKGWGLWVNIWSEGIADWCFTEEEILNEFKIRNIQIPESLLKDFRNRINKKKLKRYS